MATRSVVDPALAAEIEQAAFEQVVPAVQTVSTSTGSADMAAHRSMFNKVRDQLRAEPKVRVRVQDDTFVGLNGYQFLIQKGQSVEVPQTIADILEQAGRI